MDILISYGLLAFSCIVELIVIIVKPAKDFTIWGIIPAVWYFPFNFFSDSKNFWVIYLIVSLVTIAISVIGYYMGVAGFSIFLAFCIVVSNTVGFLPV